VNRFDWRIKESYDSTDQALKKYNRFLQEKSFRPNTVRHYAKFVRIYLKACKTTEPTVKDADRFREQLLDKQLSNSTLNNYAIAIRRYHEMMGEEIAIPHLKRNDILPYYFTEDEVLLIFGVCHNLKHLAMLQTLFYGCLRASELCNLDDEDLDLKKATIRIRDGKGGRDGIAHLSPICINTLVKYLQVRPHLEIDGRTPLFFTDFGQRWDRHDVYRMFVKYKELSKIVRLGGVHTFSRAFVCNSYGI
jgi:integrase/recombinase XerD